VSDVALPIRWQTATVVAVTPETARAKTFRLRLAQPVRQRAGQHFVLRLTAPDGYTAQRSYSVASAPDESGEIDLTVELLEGGEVSGYLHSEVQVGDELEVRGPIGGWFVWDGTSPAVLVGGGSGVVPLMAMLRLARASAKSELVRLLVSVRSPDDLYYRGEIVGPETTVIYTREAPLTDARGAGRLGSADVAAFAGSDATFYVCGSTGFAEAATQLLVDAGVKAEAIRVERFGPTG
jgi:ferredoxin-NADP reductase